jgi:beta-glucanase (GH16 family)
MQQRAPKAAAAVCAAVLLLSSSPSAIQALASTPTPTPHPSGGPSPTASPAGSASSSIASTGYTFDDEFNGTALSSRWQHHIKCCGQLVGYDPSLTTVANGYAAIKVVHRSNGWYGDLIDTKTSFFQKYGYFEARIKIPKGPGLWPAWWLLQPAGSAEIDTMEICANPIGTNLGNDAHELHNTVHWSGGATTDGRYYTIDLSQAFHVYAVDWRSTYIKFYIDGTLTYTFTQIGRIPTVALPLLLDLGLGTRWCGFATSATPSGATMLVDWVRVRA